MGRSGRPPGCKRCQCATCDVRVYPISTEGSQDERDFYEGLNVEDSVSYDTRVLLFGPLPDGNFSYPSFGVEEFKTFLRRGNHIVIFGNSTSYDDSAQNQLLSAIGVPFSFANANLYPNACTKVNVTSSHALATNVVSLSFHGASTITGQITSERVVDDLVAARQRYLGYVVAISDWEAHEECSSYGDLDKLYDNICAANLYGGCWLCSNAPKVGSVTTNIGDEITWEVPEETICETSESLFMSCGNLLGSSSFESCELFPGNKVSTLDQTITHRFRSVSPEFLSGDISLEQGHSGDLESVGSGPDSGPARYGSPCSWRKTQARGVHVLHHDSAYRLGLVQCLPNGQTKPVLEWWDEAEYEEYIFDWTSPSGSQWELISEDQPQSFQDREYQFWRDGPYPSTGTGGNPFWRWLPYSENYGMTLYLGIELRDPRLEFSQSNPFVWRMFLTTTFFNSSTIKGYTTVNPCGLPLGVCSPTYSLPASSINESEGGVTPDPNQTSVYRFTNGSQTTYHPIGRYVSNIFSNDTSGPLSCPPYRTTVDVGTDQSISIHHNFNNDRFELRCFGNSYPNPVDDEVFIPDMISYNLLIWEKEVECQDLIDGEFDLELSYDIPAEFFGLSGYRQTIHVVLDQL